MPEYDEKSKKTVGKTLHKYKGGTLKSGRGNRRVTSKKQAIAIGLSEARKKGAKVPPKKAGK